MEKEDAQFISLKEKEILKHLRKGYSNNRIAKLQNISVNTVKFHLKNIYKKLKVHNRVGAITKAKDIINS